MDSLVPHTPHPLQQELRLARSQQLQALRRLKTGHKDAKHLLCRLDDHIGDCRQGASWRITVEELADECEMSRRQAYRAIERLDEAGFIRWTSKQGQPAVFTIIWARIFEETSEERCATPALQSATGAQSCATGALQSAQLAFQSATGALPNILKKRPISAPLAPPAPSEHETAVAVIAERLKKAGVSTTPTTIDRALQLRTVSELSAIVEYFATELTIPGGPPPFDQAAGYLVWRLTDPQFRDSGPAEGWKETSPAFRAAKAQASAQSVSATISGPSMAEQARERREAQSRLESQYGEQLNSLNREQLEQLAERAEGQTRETLRGAIRNRFERACRMQFLELLDRLDKPP